MARTMKLAIFAGQIRIRLGALVVAGAVAAVAPGGIANAAERVLTIGNPFAPTSLDPAKSAYIRAGTMQLPAYEPLVRTQADGTIVPALATAWEITPDGKSATFTLRQDAKFSDGEPVNAEAAKLSIQYWASQKGPLSANLSTLESIDVIDPYKFRVNLSVGNPDLISLFSAVFLAGNLISPQALKEPEGLQTQTYGAGPYMLDAAATVSGKSYIYVPNPYYYDKSRVYWDRVVISVFEDSNSALQAMQAGQLKVLVSDALTGNTTAANLPQNVRIVSSPLQCACLFLLDRAGELNKALGDERVRKALNFGIDRALVTQALYGKFGHPSVQLQAPGFIGYDAANEKFYPYDPVKARALLAEAGYPKGFELKVGFVNNTQDRMLAIALQGELEKIGVTLTPIEYVNLGTMVPFMRKRELAAIIGTSSSGMPNLVATQFFEPHKGIGYNPFKNADPELTTLLAKASSTPIVNAEDEWKAVFRKAVDFGWVVPISMTHQTYFVADDVEVPIPGTSITIDVINMKPAK